MTSTSTANAAGLAALAELNAYHLADMAGCACPDSHESAGAKMLHHVRDGMIEALDYGTPDEIRDGSALHEIADGAPDVYTHTRWAEFVDLAAHQEEPELGAWPEDLTDAAGIALYQIADRLAGALLDLYEETSSDDEGEDE